MIHLFATRRCGDFVDAHRGIAEYQRETVTAHFVCGSALDRDLSQALALWDSLREKSCKATRFNNSARFLAAARKVENTAPQPFAALFARNDEPAALVLATVHRQSKWPGIPNGLSSFLPDLRGIICGETGLLSDPAKPAADLIAEYFSNLLQSRIVHSVKIHNIPAISAEYGALNSLPQLSQRNIRVEQCRWTRQIIHPDEGSPIEKNSKRTIQSFKRKEKRLSQSIEGDLTFLSISKLDEIDQFIRDAASITDQTYQKGLQVGISDTAEMRAFAKELAAENFFRGYLLLGGGKPISYAAGDTEGGSFHLWATSFVPDYGKFSPGIILLRKAFEHLQSQGIPVFDFGHGDSEYKSILGSEKQIEHDLRIYGLSFASRAAFFLDHASVAVRHAINKNLRNSGLYATMKKQWRRAMTRPDRRTA